VAILIMLVAMLAIVGATTHFRMRRTCNEEYYGGNWICLR